MRVKRQRDEARVKVETATAQGAASARDVARINVPDHRQRER